jgi:hypothetical protein
VGAASHCASVASAKVSRLAHDPLRDECRRARRTPVSGDPGEAWRRFFPPQRRSTITGVSSGHDDSSSRESQKERAYGVLFGILALWFIAAFCFPEGCLDRFSRAGDGLGSVGAIAGAVATLFALRQLELQRVALAEQQRHAAAEAARAEKFAADEAHAQQRALAAQRQQFLAQLGRQEGEWRRTRLHAELDRERTHFAELRRLYADWLGAVEALGVAFMVAGSDAMETGDTNVRWMHSYLIPIAAAGRRTRMVDIRDGAADRFAVVERCNINHMILETGLNPKEDPEFGVKYDAVVDRASDEIMGSLLRAEHAALNEIRERAKQRY